MDQWLNEVRGRLQNMGYDSYDDGAAVELYKCGYAVTDAAIELIEADTTPSSNAISRDL